jgi:hypothetical protein
MRSPEVGGVLDCRVLLAGMALCLAFIYSEGDQGSHWEYDRVWALVLYQPYRLVYHVCVRWCDVPHLPRTTKGIVVQTSSRIHITPFHPTQFHFIDT